MHLRQRKVIANELNTDRVSSYPRISDISRSNVWYRNPFKSQLPDKKIEYPSKAIKKKLELEQKESNIIPEFIEYCLQWSKNKSLKKISRVDIDYLLRKKGLTLSKPSREIVYNELKNLFENRLKEKDQGS